MGTLRHLERSERSFFCGSTQAPKQKLTPAPRFVIRKAKREAFEELTMKNGFKAMDSDMHVMEPHDLWQKYIDKKFLDRAPIGLNRHKRDLGIQVDGKIMPRPTPKPIPALRPIRERILNEKYPEEEARDFDNVAQVRAMDKEGLDVAIL
jgi:hypothetical protein